MQLPDRMLETLFTSGVQDLFHGLRELLEAKWFVPFTIWQTESNICSPVTGHYKNAEGRYDIHDMGYDGRACNRNTIVLEFFDERIENKCTVFFTYMGGVYGAVTFHETPEESQLCCLENVSGYLGQRLAELVARERNINVYVDYQKKLEFVKQSSRILRAVELDEVVAMALTFFMDVFSAEAGCVLHGDDFKGFGIETDDIKKHITISDMSAYDYAVKTGFTEFVEEHIECSKFNIDNVFIIFEETNNIHILLFNIHFDVIPDKEFSELVSSIVSTAVENAVYHQKMTKLKVQESEMTATGEILNKFVSQRISADRNFSIEGINFPARSAGGDYLLAKDTDEGTFFCIADVCGKGYSAAVFTVVLSVFTENAEHFAADKALDKMTDALNRFILSKNFGDRFITAFFGFICKKTKELKYLSCGHEPIMHFSDKNTKITSDFLPIGLMEEPYQVKSVNLKDGDCLFLYTDGLIEYIDEDSLMNAVKQLAESGKEAILDTLYKVLVKDTAMQKDDFTCMIIRV
ncbi:MAG: PP2C family protein-serine/threonine phosphatase [Deferribacterales bacterium]